MTKQQPQQRSVHQRPTQQPSKPQQPPKVPQPPKPQQVQQVQQPLLLQNELTCLSSIEGQLCEPFETQEPSLQSFNVPNICLPNESTLSVKNIDYHYQLSERHCSEYAQSIYHYLRWREEQKRPNPNYIEQLQIEMKPNMREILIDWLVEVGEEYHLTSETLFLTKSYIDFYLSNEYMSRDQLQLLGVGSLLIASKFEV
jgi:cyclin-A